MSINNQPPPLSSSTAGTSEQPSPSSPFNMIPFNINNNNNNNNRITTVNHSQLDSHHNNVINNTTLSELNTPSFASINFSNPNIKKEILLMIAGYLHSEGYHTSALTLLEECQVSQKKLDQKQSIIEQLCSDMREGNWNQVDTILQEFLLNNTSNNMNNNMNNNNNNNNNNSNNNSNNSNIISKSTIYSIYKQYYFELIEGGEYQKAFNILNKRIKLLKSVTTREEFSDLCLLLTCKNVNEVERFSEWSTTYNSINNHQLFSTSSRDLLIENILNENILDQSNYPNNIIPQNRLIELLNQAINFQILNSLNNRDEHVITSLLQDYESLIIPNNLLHTFNGHEENVKSIEFIGKQGLYLASASSDHSIKIWDTINRNLLFNLNGHLNRIWDLSCTQFGNLLASASSDGTIKIWDVKNLINSSSSINNSLTNNYLLSIEHCKNSYTKSDLYSVEFSPNGECIATGGYDNMVSYYDINRNTIIKRFEGHTSSVCSVVFSPSMYGSILVSGSKDKTIKLWDVKSGDCILTIDKHLGEVTGLQMNQAGDKLLSCSKDNLNRLWDIRKIDSNQKIIQKYKGHQNAYKNFIRCKFGTKERVVMSGSEDGYVYIWDTLSGELLQKLGSSNIHNEYSRDSFNGTVFDVAFNSHQGLIATAAEDTKVRLFNYVKQ